MTQKNYFTDNKLKSMRDYISSVCSKAFEAEKEKLKNSKEFAAHMQDYLSTKDYFDFVDRLGETPVEDIIDFVSATVDILYNDSDDFDRFIKDTFLAGVVQTRFGLYPNVYDSTFTPENYVDLLDTIINDSIDSQIVSQQESYAKHEMRINSFPPMDYYTATDAVRSVLEVGTLKEVEQQILNNIDFKEFVISK